MKELKSTDIRVRITKEDRIKMLSKAFREKVNLSQVIRNLIKESN